MYNGALLICGVGIAGATLAYWLSENGFEPTLIERASDVREGGSVIDLSGVGSRRFDLLIGAGCLHSVVRKLLAAFCPSLISGRGAALAMLAAYVLAGELSKRKEGPEEAFQRYQRFLPYFIIKKQAAAEQFAVSFVPQTPFELFLRNQFTKAFSVSLVAKLAMGESVVDHINLPNYPRTNSAHA